VAVDTTTSGTETRLDVERADGRGRSGRAYGSGKHGHGHLGKESCDLVVRKGARPARWSRYCSVEQSPSVEARPPRPPGPLQPCQCPWSRNAQSHALAVFSGSVRSVAHAVQFTAIFPRNCVSSSPRGRGSAARAGMDGSADVHEHNYYVLTRASMALGCCSPISSRPVPASALLLVGPMPARLIIGSPLRAAL
jgi:hypothetical protein